MEAKDVDIIHDRGTEQYGDLEIPPHVGYVAAGPFDALASVRRRPGRD
jgi:hypothetical protein